MVEASVVGRRRWRGGDRAFRGLTGLFAGAIAGVFVLIVVLLGKSAWPAWEHFGWRFLWTRDALVVDEQVFNGAAPFLYGTLVTSALALLIALPIAVGTAIALADLMPRWLARPVGLFVELLAAVPSIIFGIWGVAVIVPFVRSLRPEEFGQSLLAAGLVLAVMILPIVTAVARDMVLAVPRSQREAALALGATPWEVTWRIVLPNARSGIFAAGILGLGRAIGETMAVIMVIGYKPTILLDIFKGGATMASAIASDFGEAQGLHKSSLILIGLLMLLLSLLLTLGARGIVRSFTRTVAE